MIVLTFDCELKPFLCFTKFQRFSAEISDFDGDFDRFPCQVVVLGQHNFRLDLSRQGASLEDHGGHENENRQGPQKTVQSHDGNVGCLSRASSWITRPLFSSVA